MNIILNEAQSEALQELNYFIKKPFSSDKMLLSGSAGTGKTTLIIEFIKSVLSNTGYRIACTAPTNKAVKVLYSIFNRNVDEKRLIFTTIHSLLALNESINDAGDIEFKKTNKFIKPKIYNYDIIIIDESSMLSDELFLFINKYQNTKKIIFVGDEFQIPPVKSTKEYSIPFTKSLYRTYNIHEINLSQIMRQAKDNPIIKLSTNIRESIFEKKQDIIQNYENLVLNDKGIYFYEWKNDEQRKELVSKIDEMFLSDEYKNNTDFIKILAWRNDTVLKFANYVRSKLYGENIGKIVVGERLIADKPIFNKTQIIYNTNDEFEAKKVEIRNKHLLNEDLNYYRVYTSDKQVIEIIHEDSENKFNEMMNKLKLEAKAEPFGSLNSKRKWKYFYDKSNTFAHVKYSYSLTVHKSQGSTIDNVFVFYNDIKTNTNLLEQHRILYTACTRPRNKLFIVY